MASEDESSELPTVSGPSGPGATMPGRAGGAASEEMGPLGPGAQLGNFEILQEIGRGGMGVVYKAYEHALRRVVALKVLHPHIASDPSLAKRFRREAVLAASLNHPNIVSVFHVDDREIPRYFSMEFVEGQPLKERVDREGAMRPEEAVRIALEICDALQYAHEHNIIHRDIKPGNILLRKDLGRVMITDFGIAREISEHLAEVTQTEGFTAGTPAFMSPEQNLGHHLDARTDIFSFGMTLYYILAGRIAYEAKNRQELALAFQNQHPQPPSRFNPAISPALDQIVLKMIATDPKHRFWSCKAVAADLQKTLGSPVRPTATGRPAAGRPRLRILIVIAAVVGCILAAGGLGVLLTPYLLGKPARPTGTSQGLANPGTGKPTIPPEKTQPDTPGLTPAEKADTPAKGEPPPPPQGETPGPAVKPKEPPPDLANSMWAPDSGVRIYGTLGAAMPRFIMRRTDGQWVLYFYEGDTRTYGDTGYAISSDGTNWTRVGCALRHQAGDGAFDRVNAIINHIVEVSDGKLRAYCEGCDSPGPKARGNIFLAESTDGGWTWQGQQVVLEPTSGTPYSQHVGCPRVYRTGEGFEMYFLGQGDDGVARILRATSGDGVAWKVAGPVVGPDGHHDIGAFDIMRQPDGSLMMVMSSGLPGGQSGITTLLSKDGASWAWSEDRGPDPGQYKAVETLLCPALAEIEGARRVYFAGGHGGTSPEWNILSAKFREQPGTAAAETPQPEPDQAGSQ